MLENFIIFDENEGKGVDIDIIIINGRKQIIVDELMEGDL